MLPPGRNKVPGQIKQGGGLDSARRCCVCHLCPTVKESLRTQPGVPFIWQFNQSRAFCGGGATQGGQLQVTAQMGSSKIYKPGLCCLPNTKITKTMMWMLRGTIAISLCLEKGSDLLFIKFFFNVTKGSGPQNMCETTVHPVFMSLPFPLHVCPTCPTSVRKGDCHKCNVISPGAR